MAVFYRKYRPQKLAEIVGQEHVREALLRALASGKIAHAYLFAGPKGLGKTTTARILAKAVNCYEYRVKSPELRVKGKKDSTLKAKSQQLIASFGEPCDRCASCLAVVEGRHLDLIEIDAASNRGIDDVRELREKIRLAPVSSPYKIYIIDEAHSLTPDAFNALLKTLEEPPAHAIFILCTTEPGKLPQTIVSRCVRFDFKRATTDQLVENLARVVKEEKLEAEEGVLQRIASASDGSFRDGLSILDQLAAGRTKISQDLLGEALLSSKDAEIFDLLGFLKEENKRAAILLVNQKAQRGDDLRVYLGQIIEVLRLMLLSLAEVGGEFLDEQGSEKGVKISQLARQWREREILKLVRILQQASLEVKSAVLPQLPIEMAIVEFLQTGEESLIQSSQEEKETRLPLAGAAGSGGQAEEPKETQPSRSVAKARERRRPKVLAGEAKEIKGSEGSKTQPEAQSVGRKIGKRSGTADEVLKIWPQILAEVKKQNFSVEALLRSTRPRDFDGQTLTLEVFYRFHKERLEDPKTEKIVIAALEEILGRRAIIRCILGDRSTREEKKIPVDEATEDLAAAITEIFNQ